jgi:hypothetical protein
MTVMPAALMLESARAGDIPTMIMDAYFIHGVWVLVILTYALFHGRPAHGADCERLAPEESLRSASPGA